MRGFIIIFILQMEKLNYLHQDIQVRISELSFEPSFGLLPQRVISTKSCCYHPQRSDFSLKLHSSCGESTTGLVNKSQVGLRIRGTGSLFQKDTCQFSVSKQFALLVSFSQSAPREHTKGECILSQ